MSEWIPVKDCAPSPDILVIGHNESNGDVGIYIVNRPSDSTDLKRIKEITHWMKMPRPPNWKEGMFPCELEVKK